MWVSKSQSNPNYFKGEKNPLLTTHHMHIQAALNDFIDEKRPFFNTSRPLTTCTDPNHLLLPPPKSWQFMLQNLKKFNGLCILLFCAPQIPPTTSRTRKSFKVSMFVWLEAWFHRFIPTTKVVVDILTILKLSNNWGDVGDNLAYP